MWLHIFFSATARSASLILVSKTDKYVRETLKGPMIYLKQTRSSHVTQMQAIPHHPGTAKHLIIVRHNLLGRDQSDLTGLFRVLQPQADT